MRFLWLIAIGLVGLTICGCGGSGGGSAPQFIITSGNWAIDLEPAVGPPVLPPGVPVAGGQLVQSGSAISGTLYVTGSSCFDPVADKLVVSGTVAGGNAQQALTLSSMPVRGQVLSVSATWDNTSLPTVPPLTSPPNPVRILRADWTITGGSCAGSGTSEPQLRDFSESFSGPIQGPSWVGTLTTQPSQTGPDAQGFFHVSGTFTVSGSPCFASGSITNSSIAGEMNQVTVAMDSGQLEGSGVGGELEPSPNDGVTNSIVFAFTVHGGSCDGQNVTASVFSKAI